MNGRGVGGVLENQLSKRLIPERRSCTPSSTPFPYFLRRLLNNAYGIEAIQGLGKNGEFDLETA
jgi:hypothetical protein